MAVVNGSTYGIIEYATLKRYLFQSLYSPFINLPSFTSALADLEAGDGLPMLSLLNSRKRLPNCKNPPTELEPLPEGGMAVACGDGVGAGRSLEDITQHLEELSELSIFADVWTATARIRCSRVFSVFGLSKLSLTPPGIGTLLQRKDMKVKLSARHSSQF